jgi:hypothetical protein
VRARHLLRDEQARDHREDRAGGVVSWTKLSDDFSDDCWTLSDVAFRLHTEALVWSNRKLLDCRIPRDDVRRFSRNGELAVPELLGCGWWHQEGDVYVLQHHAGYQRTREDVVRRQAASAANGSKGGRPPKPGRELKPGGNLVANPAANLGGQDRTGQGSKAVGPEEIDQEAVQISPQTIMDDDEQMAADYEEWIKDSA